MTAREGEMPSANEGDESDRVPLQDRADDEHTRSAPSRRELTTIAGAPFRPSSEWSAAEWQEAQAEVQRRWPRRNRRPQ